MKQMETTLLLLRKENKILLAMKKRGFGAGKYNGVGGKLEKSETPEEAMIREAKEEINIIPTVFEKMGVVEFIEFGRWRMEFKEKRNRRIRRHKCVKKIFIK